MDKLEVIKTCPYGNTCEEIKEIVVDGKKKMAIHRCVSYIKMRGRDPQSEETYDKWQCSVFEWLPVLLCENARTNRGQTDAIDSLKKEALKTFSLNGTLPVLNVTNTKELT